MKLRHACLMLPSWAWALEGSVEGWWTILKTLLALGAMGAVLFGLLYAVKKMQASIPGLSRHMKIIGGLMLGQKERLVMVEIRDEWLVLGVTAHQVQVLHRMPKPADEERAQTESSSFLSMLQQKMGQKSYDQ